MFEEDLFTIQINEKYYQLIKLAISISYIQLKNNETDFSHNVNDLFLLDVDDLSSLKSKIEQNRNRESVSLGKEELLLLYTCHYVTNCFFRDPAFWNWFNEFGDDKIDSSAFREANIAGQWAAVQIIEESPQWDEDFSLRKSTLQESLGPVSDTADH